MRHHLVILIGILLLFPIVSAAIPVASFVSNQSSPIYGYAPAVIQFNDTSTNTPISWNWSFGDGSISALQNPEHSFSVGNYTVNLTATNGDGSNITLKQYQIITNQNPSVKLYLPMNSSGWVDLSPQARTVTVVGSPVLNTAIKKFGDASGYFSSTSNYVTVPDSADWAHAGSDSWSVAAWINCTDVSNNRGVFSQWADDNNVQQLFVYSNYIQYQVVSGGSTTIHQRTTSSAGSYTTGWHYVVLSKNATQYRIFLDGVEKTLDMTVGSTTAVPDIAAPMSIGVQRSTTPFSLMGHLDDVVFVNGIALNGSAVQTHEIVATGSGSSAPTYPSLSNYAGNQSFNITIPTYDGELTDYQVKYILSNSTGISGTYSGENIIYTNGTTRADWVDVNATDGSGTPLNFWIENNTYTRYNATAWVRTASIAVTNTTQARWYYGNSSQTQSSMNGLNTFFVWDDFLEGLNTTRWKQTGSTITTSPSAGTIQIHSTATSFQGINGTDTFGYNYTSVSLARQSAVTVNDNFDAVGFGDLVASFASRAIIYSDNTFAGNILYGQTRDGATSSANSLGMAGNTANHVFSVQRNGSYSVKFSINNTLINDKTTNLPTIGLPAVLTSYGTAGDDLIVDWTFIRKSTTAEPSIQLAGSGSSPSAPTYPALSNYVGNQSFNITIPTYDGALTDYQVKYILSNSTGVSGYYAPDNIIFTNGTTRADWVDVNATDGSGNPLPFWLENNTYTAKNATAWVRVSSIDVTNTTQARWYYGNASQTQSSMNGLNTFLLFDDFNVASLNTSVWGITGSPTFSGGYIFTNYSGGTVRVESLNQYSTNKSILTRGAYATSSTTDAQIGWLNSDGSKLAMVYGNNGGVATRTAFTYNTGVQRTSTGENSNYHVYDIKRISSIYNAFVVDGALLANHTTQVFSDNANISFASGGVSGGYAGVDWIAIRNLALTEPSIQLYSPSPDLTPVASFTSSSNPSIAGSNVTFTDTSSGTPSTWNWSFDNTTTWTNGSTQNPIKRFTAPGAYNVTLVANNTAGTSSPYTLTQVVTAPAASFSQSPNPSTSGNTVIFNDTTTGSPTTWNWSFGDGNTSAGRNTSYTYFSTGTFTVLLNTTYDTGFANTSATHTVLTPSNYTYAPITMSALYILTIHVVDQNAIPIPIVAINDGTTTVITTNGTGYFTVPYSLVAGTLISTGYQGRTFSIVVDNDTEVTYQMVPETNTNLNNNVIYQAQLYRFMLRNLRGTPLGGVDVRIIPMNLTINETWTQTLMGISPSVDIRNGIIFGRTGIDGSFGAPLITPMWYFVNISGTAQSGDMIDYSIPEYPPSSGGDIILSLPTNVTEIVRVKPTQAFIAYNVFNQTKNATAEVLSVNYYDPTGVTNLTIVTVTNQSGYVLNKTVYNGTAAANIVNNFTYVEGSTSPAGDLLTYGFSAYVPTAGGWNNITQPLSFNRGSSMTGSSTYNGWLAIILIVFVAAAFTASSVYIGTAAVGLMGLFFYYGAKWFQPMVPGTAFVAMCIFWTCLGVVGIIMKKSRSVF